MPADALPISLSRWYVERCGASPEGAADIPDAGLRTELLGLFGIGVDTRRRNRYRER